MLALLVDTATAAVTVGVLEVHPERTVVRAERVTVDARRHGEALAPGIAAALVAAGATPRGLAAVIAGVGPGPFTGLRVGLVTAAAVADALALPTYAVCTLDGVAAAAGSGQPLLVATDARRREVYWASYDGTGQRTRGPEVARPAAVRAMLDAGELVAARAVGSGAVRYADQLGLPVGEPAYPTVAGLAGWAAGRVRDHAPSEQLTPLYLRRPDAVEPGAAKSVLT